MAGKCSFDIAQLESHIAQLRRSLPISAYPRAQLLAFLSGRGIETRTMPKLFVIDIFNAGDGRGLLCRFNLCDEPSRGHFVAPLSQLSLDKRRSVGLRFLKMNAIRAQVVVA
jgi:hypothetical protein